MKCFMCLVAYQAHEQETINDASYVYNNQSLCDVHVNTVCGHAPEFKRHPKPFNKEWWNHLKSVHSHIVYIGDPAVIHAEVYSECAWKPETVRGRLFTPSADLEANERRLQLFEFTVEDLEKKEKSRADRLKALEADQAEVIEDLAEAREMVARLKMEKLEMKS